MRPKVLLAVCALALASTSLTLADEKDRRVVFTFDKPVSIPAVHQPGWGVLPPGTYVFKIFDSNAQRHIVQVFDKNEKTVYATILAIPNMRLKVTDKVVLTFRETKAGEPAALRAMFYPGRQYGEEFVYPKTEATRIAHNVAAPVLAMPEALKAEEATPEAPRIMAELEKAPVTTIGPTGKEEPVEMAANLPPETPAAPGTLELPKTASPLPLLVWIGLLATGSGLALRYAEKRLAAIRADR
jgi:hypothetical protein